MITQPWSDIGPYLQIDFEFEKKTCTFQITPLTENANLFSSKCIFPIIENSEMKYELVFSKETHEAWPHEEFVSKVKNNPNNLEFNLSTRLDVFRYVAYFSSVNGLSYFLDYGHVCFAQRKKNTVFEILKQLVRSKNKILPVIGDLKPEPKICMKSHGSEIIQAFYHESIREYVPLPTIDREIGKTKLSNNSIRFFDIPAFVNMVGNTMNTIKKDNIVNYDHYKKAALTDLEKIHSLVNALKDKIFLCEVNKQVTRQADFQDIGFKINNLKTFVKDTKNWHDVKFRTAIDELEHLNKIYVKKYELLRERCLSETVSYVSVYNVILNVCVIFNVLHLVAVAHKENGL
jgi:hypothetical protein